MNCLIVIPAYNESRSIGDVLTGILRLGLDVDVLVVNDGSVDNTEEIALRFPVHVVSHPCNLGYGASLQTGFKFASFHRYSHIVQFDSDGQHNPEDIQSILGALRTSRADVVIGSRFRKDAQFNPGFIKLLAIRFFRFLIWVFTRKWITDPTSGIRGVSRAVFSYYSVKDRFPADFPDADILIDMLLRRFTLIEVPVGNRDRGHGQSMHSGFKPIIYMLKVLLSTLTVVLNYRTHAEDVPHE